MKQSLIICLLLAGLTACTSTNKETTGITLNTASYTLYSDKTELFVEFMPLVVGHTSKFATHVTLLGETFLPCTEGSVTVSLFVNNNGIRNTADTPSYPGIFRLALQPKVAGSARLEFNIITPNYNDKIVIDNIVIYPDLDAAIASQHDEQPVGNEITYLKEQAWKIEFANAPALIKPFNDVVHTSGQILSAQGDEMAVTAQSDGIVKFTKPAIIAGMPVRAGQRLFLLSGGGIVNNNIDAAIKTARAELSKAKSDNDRANELIKDQLISQKEYQEIQLRYQSAKTRINTLIGNYSSAGKMITSILTGYVKDVFVTEGQYVTAGQSLATISRNKRLMLYTEVSQRNYNSVRDIQTANFMTQEGKVYSTETLYGKVIAIGKSTIQNSPMIPISFEIDNAYGLMPGTIVEVYLQSKSIENALVIPVSALLEEQGKFYAYVQTSGESFEKREISLSANNGKEVHVSNGINAGERVVIKGAYEIKLATMSSTMPAHGHEH